MGNFGKRAVATFTLYHIVSYRIVSYRIVHFSRALGVWSNVHRKLTCTWIFIIVGPPYVCMLVCVCLHVRARHVCVCLHVRARHVCVVLRVRARMCAYVSICVRGRTHVSVCAHAYKGKVRVIVIRVNCSNLMRHAPSHLLSAPCSTGQWSMLPPSCGNVP